MGSSSVLLNMESIAALLIRKLNSVAITQMKSLMSASVRKALGSKGRST